MSPAATFRLRRAELARRVGALGDEVGQWRRWSAQGDRLDLEIHSSQITALSILIGRLVERQKELLRGLEGNGPPDGFHDRSFELQIEIIRAQRTWDFFRDKLELRFSPTFKEPLWVADTIAWNCYRPVLDDLALHGVLSGDELREPPLTYLTADYSPATWVRGSRPNDGRDYDLGKALLPIPVIELPWDHVENLWELLSIAHEVGHDLEADLDLRAAQLRLIERHLTEHGAPQRVEQWKSWQAEVLADLVALQLVGPAFAFALAHLVLLPKGMVTTIEPRDPHPTHYLRILMNAAYARTLANGEARVIGEADRLEEIWRGIYGDPPEFRELISDFPAVFAALMDEELPMLGDRSLRELIPFTQHHARQIDEVAGFLLTGQNRPADVEPRHCAAGARLAAARASQAGDGLSDALQQINERLVAEVRRNAPPGLRGGGDSDRHREFIRSFADRLPFLGRAR